MAEKASEAGAPPQTPLTDEELAELDATRWTGRGVSVAITRRAAAEVRRLRARVAELEADRRRLEDAAMEVHGTSRCRYMEPMWESYTARPCFECMEAAHRLGMKADGWDSAQDRPIEVTNRPPEK
jgi:hypothetical protein